jgi:hypothetical protein
MRCASVLCVLFAILAAGQILLCQQPAVSPHATPVRNYPPAQTVTRSLTADEQSCKNFVQDFYDWYWNRFYAHMNEPNTGGFKEPTLNDVIRHRPQLLSARLQRLLLADQDLKAKNTDGIIGLEGDPFLMDGNGAGANAPFDVQDAVVVGGRCQVKLSMGSPDSEVRPELMKIRSGWIFFNFHYSFPGLPDDDLIHMLE